MPAPELITEPVDAAPTPVSGDVPVVIDEQAVETSDMPSIPEDSPTP